MIRKYFFYFLLIVSINARAQSSTYAERATQYIVQYKNFAMLEQLRSGVPAAITLGQGILETEAGNSELATKANNHFGIKCKKEWTGETFAHTDDAPNECFRKYPNALQSYKDHSDYLKSSKRYNSCFACNPIDYTSWAKELRKCGYATNPRYAQQLIKIIEDFHLQDYTYAALQRTNSGLLASTAAPVAAVSMMEKDAGEVVPNHDTPAIKEEKLVYGKVVKRNGIRGFYAHKGDVLLEYAIQYKTRYAKLLEINHLPDAPLPIDMFVALEKGNVVTQILSHDASEPQVNNTLVAPTTTKINTASHLATSSTSSIDQPSANEPKTSKLSPQIPVEKPIENVVVEPIKAVEKPLETPVNVANEVAVEEAKPITKPEEPKDEFSRMKARFDKVVFTNSEIKKEKNAKTEEKTISEPKAEVLKSATTSVQKEFHLVQKGETAFGIAKRYNITMKALMDFNKLNFEAIKVGQKLRVH